MAVGGVFTLCPEAMGVNVFRTLHAHGVPIRKNPLDTVYKVAMIGYPVNGNEIHKKVEK